MSTTTLLFHPNPTTVPRPVTKNPHPTHHLLKPLPPLPTGLPLASPLLCRSAATPRPDHGGAEEAGNTKGWVEAVGEGVSTLFPVWVGLGCVLGLYRPTSFNWVRPKWTIAGITVTMLGMGMTLTLDDLMPKELLSGFLLQYSNEAVEAGSYGNIILKLLDLQRGDSLFQYGHPRRIKSMKVVDGLDALKILSPLVAQLVAAGGLVGWSDVCLTHLKFFILGTASNIVTYIARGSVALSVLMTAGSTVSAVVMTPMLTAKLAGQFVAVDAAGLLISTLQVVLLPVLIGALLNQYCQNVVQVVSPLMPPISVATVAILCGNAIAQNASAILMSGQQVVLSVCLLRASGFFFGYILSRALGLYVSSSRTISIEVGMQNSVLGVVLAGQHFGNPDCSALCSFQRLPLYIWQFIGWNLEIQHDNRE